MTAAELTAAIGDPATFTGVAAGQIQSVVTRVQTLVDKHPQAATYTPAGIL